MADLIQKIGGAQFRERPLDPSLLAEPGATSSFISSLYARRGEMFRKRGFDALLRPGSMKGMALTVQTIAEAIDAGRQIVIVADYDADGATACAIGVRGLRMLGAKVDFVVPNRFADGYGLSAGVIDRALEKHPGLIITVDNGIAALEGVRYANSRGVPVVVTDHHLAGDCLPDAAAIVNPNQPGCEFSSKNLAGCGVMFYVLVALRRHYADRGDPRGGARIQDLLDLLALGTVADVVRLDVNNRILVDGGLRQIRSGKACAGLKAIFEVAGKSPESCSAMDLGFSIGPRINAAGRMDDAAVGIRCLIEDDPEIAHYLASELHATNQLRRDVQEDIQEDVEARMAEFEASDKFSLVVADETWHEGVIGIVAGRLKERHNRPTIVMTKSEDGVLKGSGRSIPSLHLRDALAAVDAKLPGVIIRFGGHAMAAGLTIRQESFEAFRTAFEDQVKNMLGADKALLECVIEHDGALNGSDLSLENAHQIRREVWGQGFPSPNFLFSAKVRGYRVLKDKHTKMTLDVDGVEVDAILFNQVVDKTRDVMVCGTMDINEWQGKESVQILASQIICG